MGDDVVYVVVKNDVKESRLILVWVLRNFGVKKVCIFYVYQLKIVFFVGDFCYFFWFLFLMFYM